MGNYCIILAGGIGARLWPASQTDKPKQFIDFLGTGRTLLQSTFDRMTRLFPTENILVSTHADYREIAAEQLPELPAENILAEPVRRGTLPGSFFANQVILERDEDACVLCSPSDQLVMREHEFEADVKASLEFVAKHKCPLNMGVTPTRPDTFYGYVQIGKAMRGEKDFYSVKAFTEKPDRQFAQMVGESGEFYWNTGINLWHARTMCDDLCRIEPDYAHRLMQEVERTGEKVSTIVERHFGVLRNMSLDLTIQDRLSPVAMRICHFGWADMGSWHSMHDDLPADQNGNVSLHSKALLYGCSGNVIKMPHGMTLVMQDIHDKVVVEENGILLIAPKDNYAEMRRVMTDAQMKLQ